MPPLPPLQVYAFGILMWEMYTAQRPYGNMKQQQLVEEVRGGERGGDGKCEGGEGGNMKQQQLVEEVSRQVGDPGMHLHASATPSTLLTRHPQVFTSLQASSFAPPHRL